MPWDLCSIMKIKTIIRQLFGSIRQQLKEAHVPLITLVYAMNSGMVSK